jgi:hypothetical protein
MRGREVGKFTLSLLFLGPPNFFLLNRGFWGASTECMLPCSSRGNGETSSRLRWPARVGRDWSIYALLCTYWLIYALPAPPLARLRIAPRTAPVPPNHRPRGRPYVRFLSRVARPGPNPSRDPSTPVVMNDPVQRAKGAEELPG